SAGRETKIAFASIAFSSIKQPVTYESLDGGSKRPPISLDSAIESQAEEKTLRLGVGESARRNSGAVHVLCGRFRILPAIGSVEGMGVRTESQVRLTQPIFQVVTRFDRG